MPAPCDWSRQEENGHQNATSRPKTGRSQDLCVTSSLVDRDAQPHKTIWPYPHILSSVRSRTNGIVVTGKTQALQSEPRFLILGSCPMILGGAAVQRCDKPACVYLGL
jgi:hypothetical protein